MGGLSTFEYAHDGVALRGELATPAWPGPHPAVLVIHDAHGLGAVVRERAARLAAAGYVALAADMYGGGKLFTNSGAAGGPFMALQESPALLRGRVLAGLEALRVLPQVDTGRIGAIGFCFGGQCVLELARSGADLRAVVSFHGLLKTRSPAQPGAVKAKVLVLAGAKDPYAPLEDLAGFQDEMIAAGADWQLTTYGEAWHAFTDPLAETKGVPGVRYDPLVDKLSWAQAAAFLEATLL
jgi:dienelactone hydrolase